MIFRKKRLKFQKSHQFFFIIKKITWIFLNFKSKNNEKKLYKFAKIERKQH